MEIATTQNAIQMNAKRSESTDPLEFFVISVSFNSFASF